VKVQYSPESEYVQLVVGRQSDAPHLLQVFVLLSRCKKSFVTAGAPVRKLVSVLGDLVTLHGFVFLEPFSADITLERSFSGVHSHVLLQIARLTEQLVADSTVKRLLTLVDSTLVDLQIAVPTEILVAEGATERLGATERALMLFQTCILNETLAAFNAMERLLFVVHCVLVSMQMI